VSKTLCIDSPQFEGLDLDYTQELLEALLELHNLSTEKVLMVKISLIRLKEYRIKKEYCE